MSSINKDSVVAALRSGFNNSQIAAAMGVTDSAVIQFVDAHGLAQLAAQNSKFQAVDEKLNALEETVLDKLTTSLKTAVMDPIRLTAVFKVLNAAKRRSLAEGNTIHNFNDVRLVSLNLPQHVEVKVGMNSRNEVIEVEGRPILTLPAGKLVELTNTKMRGNLNVKPTAEQIENLL